MKKLPFKIVSILIILFCFSCSELIINEPVKISHLEDFEAVRQIVKDYYPFLEFKQINWDSIYNVYLPAIEKSEGDEYMAIIVDMLKELQDGHVGIRTKGGSYISSYIYSRKIKDYYKYNAQNIENYLNADLELTESKNISYGHISGDLGYIRINTFRSGVWISEIDDAILKFENSKGLIIDVRHNDGGSTRNTNFVVRRFLKDSLRQAGKMVNEEFYPGNLLYPYLLVNYNKSVVVLINGVCYSSTEHFIQDMQQIDNVTIIGDTTGGGSSAPEYFNLPSGLQVRVSIKYLLKYNKTPIEWNGIFPDIRITNAIQEVENGTDKQLEYTIDYLSNR